MEELPHLRLVGTGEPLPYTYPGVTRGFAIAYPPRRAAFHAAKLERDLAAAIKQATDRRSEAPVRPAGKVSRIANGLVLTFESEAGFELKLKSLEDSRRKIRLLGVTKQGEVTQARVFVPNSAAVVFTRKLQEYASEVLVDVETPPQGAESLQKLADRFPEAQCKRVRTVNTDVSRLTFALPQEQQEDFAAAVASLGTIVKTVSPHQPLWNSIAAIKLSLVRDFWQDSAPFPATDQQLWWEVWLHGRREEANKIFADFELIAVAAGLKVNPRTLSFPESIVCLAYGTAGQFAASIDLLAMLAELRRAREPISPYLRLTPRDQRLFVDDVLRVLQPPAHDAPAVCILDTGVNRAHPLLAPALAETDSQAVDPEWGSADHDREQHGTGLAGIALYGCLTGPLANPNQVSLRHRLESVKILPPPPRENHPDAYGQIMQQAVFLAQERSPQRNRVICMAVTEEPYIHALPTSWSAAVDDLCAGSGDGVSQLMFVSAGNVGHQMFEPNYQYPESNLRHASIESPAQAWNALTIGAYTEKSEVTDPQWSEWHCVAPPGDLSPQSRTSLSWPDDQQGGWPFKPDLVLEGGNYLRNGEQIADCDDLLLLTTALHPTGRLFQTTGDTSGATAAAARMAAQIWSVYPGLRAETVRGILVHSANWTAAMQRRFPGDSKTAAIQQRLRCYGYGVPDLQRSLYSLRHCPTLVVESELQPYLANSRDSQSKHQMHLHTLPWPKELLLELGDLPVTMKVTLSYFIEPSPGSISWTRHFRYQSHGLRFAVNRPLDDERDKFLRRVSRTFWDEPGNRQSRPKSNPDSRHWVVGERGRTRGSLHCDWWQGLAAELAACNQIAVFPTTGWWVDRPHLNCRDKPARYSLIISLATPDESVDLYSTISNVATVQTDIQTEIQTANPGN